jgi:hypothetical protein
MKILTARIRKFFLIKEIISQEGVLHFQRYRLLSTPWFNLYLHHILCSDKDNHFHDHPWKFFSLILKGCYEELFTCAPWYDVIHYRKYRTGQVAMHSAEEAHSITLLTPAVWTLVLTTGRERVWGYQIKDGWMDFKTYRQLKRAGQLPD